MGKFDEQLSRMEYLMGYRMPVNEGKNSNSGHLEYHTEGADGKIYGILKEGTKYYIKTTEKGKENISESYDYINGFNNRKETEYKSYNEATKHLELKMMALNEAYGVHKDVSTVDFDRSQKTYATLTEDARKELDRLHQIMENSGGMGIKDNIGNHGDAESKGKSTGADTEKNNEPFDEKAKATLDKDSVASETDPKKANSDYIDADKGVEQQLTSDKAPKKATDSGDPNKDYELTHDDLDGDGVADKNPKGAKAVMVNESFGDDDFDIEYPDDDAIGGTGMPAEENFYDQGEEETYPEPDAVEEFGNAQIDDVEPESASEVGDDIVGAGNDSDLDSLMEEFESLISGDNEVLTGPDGSLDVQTCDKMDENSENTKPEAEDVEALDGPHGNGEVLTWDKMNESQKKAIDTIVENVCSKIFEDSKKTAIKESKLQESIDKIVKEEVTKLDAWGKHPKYGKEPMTTPDNKEVMKGTADRDFNDDSAKGSEKYGQKIGSSAPFDEVVDMLTDSVMNVLKESLGLKKK